MNLASLVIHCGRRYKSTGKLYSIIIMMSASSLMNRSVSRLEVQHAWLYAFTNSLLWLPVVYYYYLASPQCYLVFYTQLLYYAYLVFITTASMFLSLYCLCLACLCYNYSTVLTYNCMPRLVQSTITKYNLLSFLQLLMATHQ